MTILVMGSKCLDSFQDNETTKNNKRNKQLNDHFNIFVVKWLIK